MKLQLTKEKNEALGEAIRILQKAGFTSLSNILNPIVVVQTGTTFVRGTVSFDVPDDFIEVIK